MHAAHCLASSSYTPCAVYRGSDFSAFVPNCFSSTHSARCTVPSGRHSVNICGMYEQAAHTWCLVNNGFLKQIAQSGAERARATLPYQLWFSSLPVFTPSQLLPLGRGRGLLSRPLTLALAMCQVSGGPQRTCSIFLALSPLRHITRSTC